MFYVYALHCKKADKVYIGYSGNLKQRIRQHRTGVVHSTRRLGNCDLIFYEAFIEKKDAIQREKYLKTSKGKRTLRLMLEEYFRPHRRVKRD